MVSSPSRHAIIILAALLVTVGTVRAWRASRQSAGIDFYQYWVVGKVLARGDIPSVYDHDTRAAIGQEFLRHALAGPSPRQRAAANIRNVIEPMSTPFLFTVVTPFALGDYDTGFYTFLAASLGALVAGVFVLGRAVGLAALERVLVLAFIMFAFEPVAADLRVGNVGQLHLGMLALYVWLSAGRGTARQVVAGAVLGAATAFKPSLAAVGPLLLASWGFDRDWRRMAAQGSGLVVGGIGAVLVSAAVFGSLGAWSDWLTAVRTMPPMAIEVGNVSAVALAERSWGIRLGPLLTIVSALAVVSALGMRRRLAPPSPNRALPLDLTVVAAGCLVFLISSPLVWLHYLILALPAALLLLGAEPRRQWLSVAGLAAVAITPAGELLGVRDPIAGASIVLAGVVALFGLVLAEIAAPVPRESGSEPPDAAASRAV